MGTTQTGTGTRSADIGLLRLGKDLNGNGSADFLIDDLIYFDSVQHTSNYTPGYFVSDYEYAETNVILPEMEYTGVGTLIEATNFATSFGGSPRLTIQIGRSGNWLYWGGASWVVSNDTYAQATDPATFAANIASLPVNGEIYGQFKIYFTNTNSQGIFADLEITLTSQTYPTDNPTIEVVQGFNLEELISFTETSVKTGSDQIKYILKKGTSWYYWDGAAWSVSDETYAQSNTAAEITANIASFTNVSVSFNIRIILHSDNGLTTPSIQQLVVGYDFSGDDRDSIFTNTVYWYAINPDGTVCTDDVSARLSIFNVKYKDNIFVCRTDITATPDSTTGYVELELVENVNMEGVVSGETVNYLIFQGTRQIAEIHVPVEPGSLLWDIVI